MGRGLQCIKKEFSQPLPIWHFIYMWSMSVLELSVDLSVTKDLFVAQEVSVICSFIFAVRVRIDCPYLHWEDATVTYTTGPNSPFDLAVLKLQGELGVLQQAYGNAGIRAAMSYTQGNGCTPIVLEDVPKLQLAAALAQIECNLYCSLHPCFSVHPFLTSALFNDSISFEL